MTDQNNNILTNSLLTSYFVCHMAYATLEHNYFAVNQRCPKTTSVSEDEHRLREAASDLDSLVCRLSNE